MSPSRVRRFVEIGEAVLDESRLSSPRRRPVRGEGLAVVLPCLGAEAPERVELPELDVRAHEVRLAHEDHLPDRDGLGEELVALVVRGEASVEIVRGPPPPQPGQEGCQKADALPVGAVSAQRLFEERHRLRSLPGSPAAIASVRRRVGLQPAWSGMARPLVERRLPRGKGPRLGLRHSAPGTAGGTCRPRAIVYARHCARRHCRARSDSPCRLRFVRRRRFSAVGGAPASARTGALSRRHFPAPPHSSGG